MSSNPSDDTISGRKRNAMSRSRDISGPAESNVSSVCFSKHAISHLSGDAVAEVAADACDPNHDQVARGNGYDAVVVFI